MQPIVPPLTCHLCLKDQDVITDTESGEVICSNCGLVIADKNQDSISPEWWAFTTEEKNEKARPGSPTSFGRHDMGLSTVIGERQGCWRPDFGRFNAVLNRKAQTWALEYKFIALRIGILGRLFSISTH